MIEWLSDGWNMWFVVVVFLVVVFGSAWIWACYLDSGD